MGQEWPSKELVKEKEYSDETFLVREVRHTGIYKPRAKQNGRRMSARSEKKLGHERLVVQATLIFLSLSVRVEYLGCDS